MVLAEPIADFQLRTTSPCVGVALDLQNKSKNATRYFWNFGDRDTSDEFEPLHQYDSVGTFLVMLIATNGFCFDTMNQSFQVGQKPIADFSMPQSPFCENVSIMFTNISTNADSFLWNF